jgi:para-aminobenzoate synthetase component I
VNSQCHLISTVYITQLNQRATSTTSVFPITNFKEIKAKVLSWIQQFSTFCFLDNHQYQIPPHSMECLLGAGLKRSLRVPAASLQTINPTALDQLQSFRGQQANSWLFGHLGYDLKNEIEQLSSSHPDPIGFPDLFFFEPEVVIRMTESEMTIEADHPALVFATILDIMPATAIPSVVQPITNSMSKEEYCAVIEQLRQHILRGDCYEINYCQQFFSANAHIHPVTVYQQLSEVSPNPFSALYRTGDTWLICASPERFLKKQETKILSQPIKGTSIRIPHDQTADNHSKEALHNSAKDRSENVMVVDLVRNDLARVCEEGTVKVDELYGIYSFPQVHQMISTVSGVLKPGISFTEIIRATFPMGSMTGAPKKRVMELIERYELTKRGIFSGAVGYIAPNDDFDFNVVIRSIMYNAATSYLSFQAGSGITFYSDPEKEWEECLIKAEAMRKALEKL